MLVRLTNISLVFHMEIALIGLINDLSFNSLLYYLVAPGFFVALQCVRSAPFIRQPCFFYVSLRLWGE
jgi:hypothetical protein